MLKQLELVSAKWRSFSVTTKWALIVWSLVIVIPLARAAMAPRSNTVYIIFADAARNWSNGQDLYRASPEPYRYSPFVAILFEPFSRLPDSLGGLLWRLTNAGVFLFSLGWFCRKVLPASLSTTHLSVLFLMIAPLCIGNLNNGQSNLLIVGLFLAAVATLMEERWNLTALCLVLACLFKIYPIALALLLILYYPRQLSLRFIAMIAAGLFLPFLLQSPQYVVDQYAGWLDHLRNDDRQVLARELWYLDFRLLWRSWFAPLSHETYLVIQLLVGMAIGFVCWLAKRAMWPREKLALLSLGLASCWMTVCGPASESATYVLLAPMSAWLALDSIRSKPISLSKGLFLFSYALLLASQISNWFPFGREFQHLGPQPLAAIFIFLGIVIESLPALISQNVFKALAGPSSFSQAA
jgi:hypothetical protein